MEIDLTLGTTNKLFMHPNVVSIQIFESNGHVFVVVAVVDVEAHSAPSGQIPQEFAKLS